MVLDDEDIGRMLAMVADRRRQDIEGRINQLLNALMEQRSDSIPASACTRVREMSGKIAPFTRGAGLND